VTLLFILLAMAVVAVIAGLVTGRIAGGMDAPESSLPFRGLPPEGVGPIDLETLRFSSALRGYRMDEVDQVLDRLGEELYRRDDEIARLRAERVDPARQGPDAQAVPSIQPEQHVGPPPGQG
jgi:DivIVA domain-containing protein